MEKTGGLNERGLKTNFKNKRPGVISLRVRFVILDRLGTAPRVSTQEGIGLLISNVTDSNGQAGPRVASAVIDDA